MAPRPKDIAVAVTIVPVAALVVGAPATAVFGLVLLATAIVRPRLAPIALAVSAFPMLQLVPLPAGFGRRFCEAAELGIDVTPRISIAPHETLVDAVQLAGCIALFFLTRELTRRTEHGLFVGAIGLAAIGGWQAVQGIEQYATGLVSDDAEAIARGAFVHRGHYAALLAGSAGVAVGLAASYLRRLPWLGVAAGAAAGLSLVAAAASLSRLGLVAALCSMLLAAGALTRRRAGLTAAALLVTLGAGAAVVNPEHVTQRFSELIEQRGDPGRLAIWRDSVRALEEGPLLGSGLGAFPYAFRRSEMYFPRKSVEHAHSDYLEFVVELGALGAGMLFLAIGAVFVSAVRGVRAEADDSRRPIRLGCLAGAAAIAVCATADFPLHSPPVAAMLAALLGLADATTEHRTGVRGPKLERSTRLWDPGLPSGALLSVTWASAYALIALALQLGFSQWDPATPYQEATQAATAQQDRLAEAHFKEALARNPFSAPAWLCLAEIELARGRRQQALELLRIANRVEPLTLRTEWPLAELERSTSRFDAIVAAVPDLRQARPRAADGQSATTDAR